MEEKQVGREEKKDPEKFELYVYNYIYTYIYNYMSIIIYYKYLIILYIIKYI